MKKIFFFLILFLVITSLPACKIEENYAMQGVFTHELAAQSSVIAKDKKLTVEVPIADFSCNIDSFETFLERQRDTFIVTLVGDETEERCEVNFTGTISEIQTGDYWVKVIYKKGDEEQELLFKEFFMN